MYYINYRGKNNKKRGLPPRFSKFHTAQAAVLG
jgi:hypothetical protein